MAVYFEIDRIFYKVSDSTKEDLELIADKIAENISNGVACAYKMDDTHYAVLNFSGRDGVRVTYRGGNGPNGPRRLITKRELGIISVAVPNA